MIMPKLISYNKHSVFFFFFKSDNVGMKQILAWPISNSGTRLKNISSIIGLLVFPTFFYPNNNNSLVEKKSSNKIGKHAPTHENSCHSLTTLDWPTYCYVPNDAPCHCGNQDISFPSHVPCCPEQVWRQQEISYGKYLPKTMRPAREPVHVRLVIDL